MGAGRTVSDLEDTANGFHKLTFFCTFFSFYHEISGNTRKIVLNTGEIPAVLFKQVVDEGDIFLRNGKVSSTVTVLNDTAVIPGNGKHLTVDGDGDIFVKAAGRGIGEKDFLIECGYLLGPNEVEGVQTEDLYQWAFWPGMQSVEGTEVFFEMVHYSVGDSGTQFGIMLGALFAAVLFMAAVILRRKYILQADRGRGLYEQAMADTAHEAPEEERSPEE